MHAPDDGLAPRSAIGGRPDAVVPAFACTLVLHAKNSEVGSTSRSVSRVRIADLGRAHDRSPLPAAQPREVTPAGPGRQAAFRTPRSSRPAAPAHHARHARTAPDRSTHAGPDG